MSSTPACLHGKQRKKEGWEEGRKEGREEINASQRVRSGVWAAKNNLNVQLFFL
jgi:flagellar biosynthesis/type III secretory pathway protein FliH